MEWIIAVFDACRAAPWHNYLFLTKNPDLYAELSRLGLLPAGDNFWYGTWINGLSEAFVSDQYHTFACVEPLGAFAEKYCCPKRNGSSSAVKNCCQATAICRNAIGWT